MIYLGGRKEKVRRWEDGKVRKWEGREMRKFKWSTEKVEKVEKVGWGGFLIRS